MLEIQSSKIVLTLVDTETGELFTKEATFGDFKEATKKSTTTRTRKIKDDGETEPMIHVLENKLQFNNKAVELTGFEADEKILIDFEKKGRKITPVCRVDLKGNRMTKTHTVSYRGQQRETLLQYGDNFVLEPYPDKEGWYKLIGNAPEQEDDIIDVPEEISINDNEDITSEDIGDMFDNIEL